MNLALQASKWLSIQALLDVEEMSSLLSSLGDFSIYPTGAPLKNKACEFSKQAFIDNYRLYITALKEGKIADPNLHRPYFSSIWTKSDQAITFKEVANTTWLLRVTEPVIQLQPHQLTYSKERGTFHSMVLGRDTISWGVQFSFPQLVEDPQTRQVWQTRNNTPNWELFHTLQAWFRKETLPTPFKVEGKILRIPVRIGKKTLSWIAQHPQLKKEGIEVNPLP